MAQRFFLLSRFSIGHTKEKKNNKRWQRKKENNVHNQRSQIHSEMMCARSLKCNAQLFGVPVSFDLLIWCADEICIIFSLKLRDVLLFVAIFLFLMRRSMLLPGEKLKFMAKIALCAR